MRGDAAANAAAKIRQEWRHCTASKKNKMRMTIMTVITELCTDGGYVSEFKHMHGYAIGLDKGGGGGSDSAVIDQQGDSNSL